CQALSPRTFEWHYLDAVVLQHLARQSDAAAQLRQALLVSPDYLPARVKLAETLLDSGDLDESGRLFEALVAQPRAEPAAHFGLGPIPGARGQHDNATAHVQRAVELFSEWGAAYYALALSYRALGRRDEAQQALIRHTEYGARWPALEDPALSAVAALRNDAQANVRRGVKLAE